MVCAVLGGFVATAACRQRGQQVDEQRGPAATATVAQSPAETAIEEACGAKIVQDHPSVRQAVAQDPQLDGIAVIRMAAAQEVAGGHLAAGAELIECAIALGDDTVYHRRRAASLAMLDRVGRRLRDAERTDRASGEMKLQLEAELAEARAALAAENAGASILNGYMVHQHAVGLYEIAVPGSSQHALLMTTETVFQSKGQFQLRVRELSEVPIQVLPSLGSFTQIWKVYQEAPPNPEFEATVRSLEAQLLTGAVPSTVGSSQFLRLQLAAWESGVAGLFPPTRLPTPLEVQQAGLDTEDPRLSPPGDALVAFVAPALKLVRDYGSAAYGGNCDDCGPPDWEGALADINAAGDLALPYIEAEIREHRNHGAVHALSLSPTLAAAMQGLIRDQLQAPEAVMRMEAARTLAIVGLGDERVAEVLVAAVRTDDIEYGLAIPAIEGLEALPPQSPRLAALLKPTDLDPWYGRGRRLVEKWHQAAPAVAGSQ